MVVVFVGAVVKEIRSVLRLIFTSNKKFLIFALTLVFSAISYRSWMGVGMKQNLEIVTDIGTTEVKAIDPRKVSSITEAIILLHLYDSLVDYDSTGRIVSSLAESFYWNAGSLVFEIGEKVKTSTGRPLDALDVLISLNLLMLDKNNLHGDLKEILCPNEEIRGIDRECSGLKIQNNKVIITPRDPKYNPWLLDLLASIDYRIIPRENIDTNKLETIKHLEFSGAYRLIEDSDSRIIFEANKNHYSYHPRMPQKVTWIKSDESSADLFILGQTNLINTANIINNDAYEKIIQQRQNIAISRSYEISVEMIKFSKAAIKRLSPEERFSAADKISKRILRDYKKYGHQPTNLFFQTYGEKYISDEQQSQVQLIRNKYSATKLKNEVKLPVTQKRKEKWKDFFENNPQIIPVPYKIFPYLLPHNERPDAFYVFTDLAISLDLATISYNMKQGTFGLFDEEADKWLKDFVATESADKRRDMITELHYNALKNCYIYPFSKLPYTIITTDNWEINQNKYLAATMLWNMRHK